jgi:hypothetical protein
MSTQMTLTTSSSSRHRMPSWLLMGGNAAGLLALYLQMHQVTHAGQASCRCCYSTHGPNMAQVQAQKSYLLQQASKRYSVPITHAKRRCSSSRLGQAAQGRGGGAHIRHSTSCCSTTYDMVLEPGINSSPSHLHEHM